MLSFGEVSEAADKLSVEEQEVLIEIPRRRIMEHQRMGLAKDFQDARKEFQEGGCKIVSPGEIMKEILS
jgi:hypothetical protein